MSHPQDHSYYFEKAQVNPNVSKIQKHIFKHSKFLTIAHEQFENDEDKKERERDIKIPKTGSIKVNCTQIISNNEENQNHSSIVINESVIDRSEISQKSSIKNEEFKEFISSNPNESFTQQNIGMIRNNLKIIRAQLSKQEEVCKMISEARIKKTSTKDEESQTHNNRLNISSEEKQENINEKIIPEERNFEISMNSISSEKLGMSSFLNIESSEEKKEDLILQRSDIIIPSNEASSNMISELQ